MGAKHPLPYSFAKANTLLLERDGDRHTLWATEAVSLSTLSEVLRLYGVDALEYEASSTLAHRIAEVYARARSICLA